MIKFEQARAVNALVNNTTQYRCDIDLYEKPEFWEIAQGQGDCEDYALAKRAKLIDSGAATKDLHLATCWTEMDDYHAVLIVETEEEGFVVLDNRYPRPVRKGDIGYRWEKIEEDGVWHVLS